MIYADDALEQLRNCLSSSGINYAVDGVNQKMVQVMANPSGVSILTWFDVEHQIFGFNMVSGGCKTYDNINDFKSYFVTYIAIYTDFIPSAKVVSNKFEEDFGIQSIYDNFSGNKKSGYTAIFRILGRTTQKLRIKNKDGNYFTVSLTEQEDGVSKYRVISEYKYILVDDKTAKLIPTIDAYAEKVFNICNSSEDIDVKRIGLCSFSFEIEGLEIVTDVSFEDDTITYNIRSAGDLELGDSSKFTPNDPYSVDELYEYCKNYFDNYDGEADDSEGSNSGVATSDVSEDSVADTSEDSDSDGDESDDSYSSGDASDEGNSGVDTSTNEGDSEEDLPNSGVVTLTDESNSEVGISEEVENPTDDTQDSENPDNSGVVSSSTSEVCEVMSLVLKTVKNENNEVVSIHFITEDAIYNMSVEKAIDMEIPVVRIKESIEVLENGVFPMTTDEKRLHVFVKDISDNDEVCGKLFQALFD